jgi:peptidyl-prolyl cis-trans isomerase D
MATLEKIRQRKKILAIVIGAALLAFIIEVGIEAWGRSGGNSAAAKVGNEKIDIMHFSKEVEKAAAEAQQNNQDQVDPAVRQQQVLDDMINEKLLEKEYESLGITVSDKEISELMIGKNPAPAVVQFAQQVGAKSPLDLYEFIKNPDKQGVQKSQVAELENQWNKLQDDIVKQYKFAKLQNLLAGCMQANDLDRAQLAEEGAVTNVLTFAKKDYSSLPDDKYTVSDEELKAEWEKMKFMFKLDEEARAIHFIAVDIAPSAEDIAAANKIADAAYLALQKGRGVDSVRLLGTVHIDSTIVTKDKLPAKVRDFFAGAEIGTVRRDTTTGEHHQMYKLINKQVSIDSVMLSYVSVQGDAKMQKTVMDQLNAGKSLDELKKTYPQKVDGKQGEWQRLYGIADSLKNKVGNAAIGTYFVYNSADQGAILMKVDEKKAPKLFYTLATITYDAYASTKTSDALRDKFQDFLNKNKTAKDFKENAAKAGYNAIDAIVTPSSPQLTSPYTRGIKDTRKAVKWVFDNKKDMVSPIFSDNNNVLVAVSVDDIYKDGYLPYTFEQGKQMLTERVRNSKKGDALMKQYKGKANDINGYAALMGSKVDTARVAFSGMSDPKLGQEPGLVGRIATAKPGTLQGPWKGENAVIVYQIVKQEKEERKPSKEELDNRYAQARGIQSLVNPQSIYHILSKATKVTKHLIDFY